MTMKSIITVKNAVYDTARIKDPVSIESCKKLCNVKQKMSCQPVQN